MSPPDRGAAAVWVAGLLAVLGLAAAVVAGTAAAVTLRHRAQAAADLAALAGAGRIGVDPAQACPAAARVAAANHATVTSCTTRLDAAGRTGETRVVVALAGTVGTVDLRVVARARAARIPSSAAGLGAVWQHDPGRGGTVGRDPPPTASSRRACTTVRGPLCLGGPLWT